MTPYYRGYLYGSTGKAICNWFWVGALGIPWGQGYSDGMIDRVVVMSTRRDELEVVEWIAARKLKPEDAT